MLGPVHSFRIICVRFRHFNSLNVVSERAASLPRVRCWDGRTWNGGRRMILILGEQITNIEGWAIVQAS